LNRGSFFAISAVLVVGLVASALVQVWALPPAAASVGATFPEAALLVVPGVTWGVLAIACWQAAAVFGLRVVVLVRQRRSGAAASGWLLAMVGCLIAFLALVVAAFIALSVMGYTTPGVMLGLIGGGLLALIAIGALGALARFLRAGASSPQYSHD